MPEAERVNAYLATLDRIEPVIANIDVSTAAASMSISLKRVADVLERFETKLTAPALFEVLAALQVIADAAALQVLAGADAAKHRKDPSE